MPEEKPKGTLSDGRAQTSNVSMTRRELLASAGKGALVAAALPIACAPLADGPWADGTFWNDGLGWTD